MTLSPPLLLPGLSWLLLLTVMCLAPLPCHFTPQEGERLGKEPDPPLPPDKDCFSKPDNHSCKQSHLHQNEVYNDHGVPKEGTLPADEDTETEIEDETVEDEEEELTTRRKRSYPSKGQGHEVPNRRKKRGIMINDPTKLWTNGIVPYVINYDKLALWEVISINTTMAFVEKYTCIRFVPWNSTTKALYGLANNGRLIFTITGGCNSLIGNTNQNGQNIQCCYPTACIHEIGHALGLYHEHKHTNRDMLRMDWLAQNPQDTWKFREVQKGEALFTKYDVSSPMHYPLENGGATYLFPDVLRTTRHKYFFEIISDTYQCQTRNCSHFTRKCHNSGFVTLVNGTCRCYCPHGLDPSTDCSTVRTKTARRTFPGGSFAIPSPRDGCPTGHGFQTEVVIHSYDYVWDLGIRELQDSMADHTVTTVLCTRHSTDTNAARWPAGEYCIYRVGVCPPEFQYSNLTMETTNKKTSGNFSYVDKGLNYVTFHFCCRSERRLEPMDMFNTQPFVLLRKGRHSCEKVAGMRELQQVYEVKDPNVHKLFTGPLGYSTKGPSVLRYSNGNTKFWFCYYYPVTDNTLPMSPCEDGHANCSSLAHEHCNNAQVAQNCPYSCNTCSGIKGAGDCVDKDNDCRPESCSTYSNSKLQNCNFTCRRCAEFCGGIIKLTKDAPEATISSPGYPQNYNNNLDCFWQITGPPDSTLLLTVTDFDVEGSPKGCKDKLEVNFARLDYAGKSFCGRQFYQTIRSIYNEMELRFHTDYQNQRRGFLSKVTMKLPESHCFDPRGRGEDYRGNVSYTRDWKPCVPWNQTTSCKHHTFAPYDLLDDLRENFCRNPGNGLRPWCYTSTKCDRSYCDVCFLESTYDTDSGCDAFKVNGRCSGDPVEARRKCARTCANHLPPRTKPPSYTTVKCGPPSPPADAQSGYNLASEYAVGQNVSFTCKDNANLIHQTTCLSSGQWSPLGYVCGGCPNGWTFHDNSCFLESTTSLIYDKARAHCLSLQAYVAEPRTQEDIRFLIQLKDDGRVQWIGLRKDAKSCFRWEDGTRPSWTKWVSGGISSHVCVAVTNALQMLHWNCDIHNLFVCQRPALNSSVCADFLPDCASWVAKYPSICQEPDFAKFSCPKTCYGNSSCQDPCHSSPCLNGGKCYIRGGAFQCVCSKNFYGTRCENKTDTSGSCQDTMCDCSIHKDANRCNGGIRHYILPLCARTCGLCDGNASPCSDSATNCTTLTPNQCQQDPHNMFQQCRKSCNYCVDGPTCVDRSDQCSTWITPNACKTNDTVKRLCPNGCNLCFNPRCIDRNGNCGWWAGAFCTHPAYQGYMEYNCAYSCHTCRTIFKCYNLPCKNNGTCKEDSSAAAGYTCNCTGTGFTGPTCQQQQQRREVRSPFTRVTHPPWLSFVPTCWPPPCKNNGTCTMTPEIIPHGFTCNCSGTGFTGITCEQLELKCSSKPCKNNGTCSENNGTADGYTCDCSGTGFTGSTCEQPEPKCSIKPCKNNGTCSEDSGAASGYTCDCSGTGFTGPTCEQRILRCTEGWELHDGFCYKFFSAKKTYDDAQASCPSAVTGAKIPIISSLSENAFIHKLAGKKSQWVNARRSDSNSQFRWSDGSLVSESFSNWAPNNPKKHEGKDCACFRRSDGRWRVLPCVRKRRYVCKVKAS